MRFDKDANILIIGLGVIGGSYATVLTEKGYKIVHTVAIMVKEKDNEYKVSQNYMSTGISFGMNELDLTDLENDGIKIWRTWSYCN